MKKKKTAEQHLKASSWCKRATLSVCHNLTRWSVNRLPNPARSTATTLRKVMQKCHPVMIKLPLKEHPHSLSATPYFLQQSFSCFLCFLVLLCVFFFLMWARSARLLLFPQIKEHWLVPQNYNWLKKAHQIHSSICNARLQRQHQLEEQT